MLRKKSKILVVDDSLLIRKVLSDIINADPYMEVVDTAYNGQNAVEKAKKCQPDLITMDVEMPIMNGVEAVKQIMRENPTPILMVSSITFEGGQATFQALEAGALDYIQKPKAQASSSLNNVAKEIILKIRAILESPLALRMKNDVQFLDRDKSKSLEEKEGPQAKNAPQKNSGLVVHQKLMTLREPQNMLIAIGISTGGPPVVSKIFECMPANCPPILVVQHMPKEYTKSFADRINKISAMEVKEGEDGDIIKVGRGIIAPGHSHITIYKVAGIPKIRLSQKGPVSGHQPSADVLFESTLENFGKNCVGLLLTGMGRDGATHLAGLHKAGAYTAAQSEESCVVFGMPRAAIMEKSVDEVLNIPEIISRLQFICSKMPKVSLLG